MAQTNDTIDGLLAEFRGYSAGMPPSYHVTMSWADFRKMLDRFEAAHKREVAVSKTETTTGDAKMREALVSISSILKGFDFDNQNAPTPDDLNCVHSAIGIADAALAEPPKNCEVGTVKEQTARFAEFCKSHIHSDLPRCAGCPLEDIPDGTGCAQAWAQLQYEAEEGGAK